MMMLLLIALFIEAIVSAVKPLWSHSGEHMSVAEVFSIVIGMVLAVTCRLNILRMVAGDAIMADSPPWVEYIYYAMSGVAIGRGPSFLWDLWQRIKDLDLKGIAPEAEIKADLNIAHWSLEQLSDFCTLNDIPCAGCVTREDYIDAIEHMGRVSDEPPNNAV